MKRALPLVLALLPVGALTSCRIHVGHGALSVDGVSLDEEHEETLEILEWHPDGLTVEVAAGDVRVEPAADGQPSEVRATIHERWSMDGRLEHRDGRLVVVTESGEPALLGDVVVRVAGRLPHARLSTAGGDVEIAGVAVTGRLEVSTGAGDVRVKSVGRLVSAEVSTGMGDVRLASLDADSIDVSTGMGDVRLVSLSGGTAVLETGMGDVHVQDGDFDRLEASTGMGDLDVAGARYASAELDTGMGSVRRGAMR